MLPPPSHRPHRRRSTPLSVLLPRVVASSAPARGTLSRASLAQSYLRPRHLVAPPDFDKPKNGGGGGSSTSTAGTGPPPLLNTTIAVANARARERDTRRRAEQQAAAEAAASRRATAPPDYLQFQQQYLQQQQLYAYAAAPAPFEQTAWYPAAAAPAAVPFGFPAQTAAVFSQQQSPMQLHTSSRPPSRPFARLQSASTYSRPHSRVGSAGGIASDHPHHPFAATQPLPPASSAFFLPAAEDDPLGDVSAFDPALYFGDAAAVALAAAAAAAAQTNNASKQYQRPYTSPPVGAGSAWTTAGQQPQFYSQQQQHHGSNSHHFSSDSQQQQQPLQHPDSAANGVGADLSGATEGGADGSSTSPEAHHRRRSSHRGEVTTAGFHFEEKQQQQQRQPPPSTSQSMRQYSVSTPSPPVSASTGNTGANPFSSASSGTNVSGFGAHNPLLEFILPRRSGGEDDRAIRIRSYVAPAPSSYDVTTNTDGADDAATAASSPASSGALATVPEDQQQHGSGKSHTGGGSGASYTLRRLRPEQLLSDLTFPPTPAPPAPRPTPASSSTSSSKGAADAAARNGGANATTTKGNPPSLSSVALSALAAKKDAERLAAMEALDPFGVGDGGTIIMTSGANAAAAAAAAAQHRQGEAKEDDEDEEEEEIDLHSVLPRHRSTQGSSVVGFGGAASTDLMDLYFFLTDARCPIFRGSGNRQRASISAAATADTAAAQDKAATSQFAFAGAWRPAHSQAATAATKGPHTQTAGSRTPNDGPASTDARATTTAAAAADAGGDEDATQRASLAARFDIDLAHLAALCEAAGGQAATALGYLHLLVPKGSMVAAADAGGTGSGLALSGTGSSSSGPHHHLVVPFDPFISMDELTHTVRGMRERDQVARVPLPVWKGGDDGDHQLHSSTRARADGKKHAAAVTPMALYGSSSSSSRHPRVDSLPLVAPPSEKAVAPPLHFSPRALEAALANDHARRKEEEAQAILIAQELLNYRPPAAAAATAAAARKE